MIRRRFDYDRGTAAAMENRGVVASWDALSQRMTIWDTTQAPIPIRNGLAKMLGLSENQVRVIAPFIGGGFGPEGDDVLSGRDCGAVGIDAAQSSGEMD